MYDGAGAATPPTACAVGTSATLALVLGSGGQSVGGTFIVADGEIGVGADGSHTYTATFKATGTVTYDVAA